MSNEDDCLTQLAELERALKHHRQAEVKNFEHLDRLRHPHTAALCRAVRGLLDAFPDRKIVVLIEAEICKLGWRARPEDAVAWIEGVGVFVLEVKSHTIQGIRSFENNVPQVIYQGCEVGDVDLLEQPRDFAYKLKGEMEKAYDAAEIEPPPLYFAGWLPNVTPEDIGRLSATVTQGKVWLSDMLQRETFLAKLSCMKNLTAGTVASRESLQLFCNMFGCTSGLRRDASDKVKPVGSLGHLIDRRNRQLKKLTKEQQDLAFSPNLLVGPKVIRGVVGSGKTIVLANAVAETLLASYNRIFRPELLDCTPVTRVPPVLVLCYNRCLVPYLHDLIRECFEDRKTKSEWRLPAGALKVINIDRYAHQLATRAGVDTDRDRPGETVRRLLDAGCHERQKYAHVFIDEGQDIKLDWYPLIREVAANGSEAGPSIIVFYDDAQNVYTVKRPGTADAPAWKELLGSVPNPRGLRTIMRVGHRNTNEILTFSYNLLLGAFAERNPQMAEFAGLAEYEKETIPEDASLDHPRAGKPCVERLDDRQYRVNFAVSEGRPPDLHVSPTEELMLNDLASTVQRLVAPEQGNVDFSDILIMTPEKEQSGRVVDALASRGIDVHVPLKCDKNGRRNGNGSGRVDPRDQAFFQRGKVTVSTIKSAKGYTAHVCHLAFVHTLRSDSPQKERRQQSRSELHVACTRSSLRLELWGLQCPLMNEAEDALALLASCR